MHIVKTGAFTQDILPRPEPDLVPKFTVAGRPLGPQGERKDLEGI
jgi:hypothetical protein